MSFLKTIIKNFGRKILQNIKKTFFLIIIIFILNLIFVTVLKKNLLSDNVRNIISQIVLSPSNLFHTSIIWTLFSIIGLSLFENTKIFGIFKLLSAFLKSFLSVFNIFRNIKNILYLSAFFIALLISMYFNNIYITSSLTAITVLAMAFPTGSGLAFTTASLINIKSKNMEKASQQTMYLLNGLTAGVLLFSVVFPTKYSNQIIYFTLGFLFVILTILIRKKIKISKKAVIGVILFCALLTVYSSQPVPYYRYNNLSRQQLDERVNDYINRFEKTVEDIEKNDIPRVKELVKKRIEKIDNDLKQAQSKLAELQKSSNKNQYDIDITKLFIDVHSFNLRILRQYESKGITTLDSELAAITEEYNKLVDNQTASTFSVRRGYSYWHDWDGDFIHVRAELAGVYFYKWSEKKAKELLSLAKSRRNKGISEAEYEKFVKDFNERDSHKDGLGPSPYNRYKLTVSNEKELYDYLRALRFSTGYVSKTITQTDWDNISYTDYVKNTALPLAGIFAALLLATGIAGAGSSINMNQSEKTDDSDDYAEEVIENEEILEESDEEMEKPRIFIQQEDNTFTVGDRKKECFFWLSVEGGKDQNVNNKILKSVKILKPSGLVADFIHVEETDNYGNAGYRRFKVCFTYKIHRPGSEEGDTGLTFPLTFELTASSSREADSAKAVYKVEKSENKVTVSEKSIVIGENSKKHIELRAKVFSIEPVDWEFDVEIPSENKLNAVDDYKVTKISGGEARLQFKGAVIPEGFGNYVNSEVIIKAKNNVTGSVAETELKITCAKDGLIPVTENPVKITADGMTETELKITALKTDNDRLETDFNLLYNVVFDNNIETTDEVSKNAFEAAKIIINPVNSSQITSSNWEDIKNFGENKITAFKYRIKTKHELPGWGESYSGVLYVKDTENKYKVSIPLKLEVEMPDRESEVWQKEYSNCLKIIEFVPEQFRQKLRDMVEKRKQFLGAKGLYDLRHQIWSFGRAMWQAEGYSAYNDVEKWAARIENMLNVANWAGNIATTVVTMKYQMSVYGLMATGELYNILSSLIKALMEGKSFDDWVDECLWEHIKEICQIGLGSVFDPDKIAELMSKNPRAKALAWTAYFCYHTYTNVIIHKMDFHSAVIKAGKSTVQTAAMKYTMKKIQSKLQKKSDISKNDKELSAESKKTGGIDTKKEIDIETKVKIEAKNKISEFEKAVEKGDRKEIKKLMLEIQNKNKLALNELNISGSEQAKMIYKTEINKLHSAADQRVKKKIIQQYKEKGIEIKSKDIKITNESNVVKGGKVKVSSDRDIAGEIVVNGKKVELSKKELDNLYGEAYGREMKLSKRYTPEEVMKDYDFYGIDSKDHEAIGNRVAKFTRDNDGNLIKTFKNEDLGKALGKEKFFVKYENAQQVGDAQAYKAYHWYEKTAKTDSEKIGNIIEGHRQHVKFIKGGYTNLKDTLIMQGEKFKEPPAIKEISKAIEKATKNEISTEAVDSLVKKHGFKSTKDYVQYVGNFFAEMNKAVK